MIESSVNHMNPVNVSNQTKSRFASKKTMFYNWLRKKGGEKAVRKAKKSESIYQRNRRYIDAISSNRELRRRYSVYPY